MFISGLSEKTFIIGFSNSTLGEGLILTLGDTDGDKDGLKDGLRLGLKLGEMLGLNDGEIDGDKLTAEVSKLLQPN